MSNQQPWTLLQVGDKVVFKPSTGTTNENIFTITSISHRGYSGTWSGMNFGPLSMDGSAWWVNKLRVEKPWYPAVGCGGYVQELYWVRLHSGAGRGWEDRGCLEG
jgi:hypothetical protein